ncbi:MAG: mannonate dehydratase [Bacteroidota bacterium]
MAQLLPSWRWYGPQDPIQLLEIKAAGAKGIVTALHQIENGAIWTKAEIQERNKEVSSAGLHWSVVESLPVHEGIKTNNAVASVLLKNYLLSLENLAACGIDTICYNFMPVLDWTRTNLQKPVPGGTTLELRAVELVAFDCFLLEREGAKASYDAELVQAAADYFDTLDAAQRESLAATLLLGLPGSEETYSLEEFRAALSTYDHISAANFRENLFRFLEAVMPRAQELGIKMTIHPDDPPYSVLGLPRIVSTAEDLRAVVKTVDLTANGLCFCTGSLASRADNDLVTLATELAERIHFVHLRNVQRGAHGSFFESGHLQGDADIAGVMKALMTDGTDRSLAYRPDHGFKLLDDQNRTSYPGYSLYGRLRGLAELEGLRHGLAYS